MTEIFRRLVVWETRRAEAETQADVRQFILSAPFELEDGDLIDVTLEPPLGDRRRIDVEADSTVIEVKRDLRREKAKRGRGADRWIRRFPHDPDSLKASLIVVRDDRPLVFGDVLDVETVDVQLPARFQTVAQWRAQHPMPIVRCSHA